MEDKKVRDEMKKTVDRLNFLIREAVVENRLRVDIHSFNQYNEMGTKHFVTLITFEMYKEV